ncbi:MAG: hypothetical protein IJ710_08525 [Prevotella sp.]|nr:hypothetical protein [Prevotella sp.]
MLTVNRFFKPFVGTEYDKGICGKRILVLGASFYCSHSPESSSPCRFFAECTSPERKDSSRFDSCCPFYEGAGLRLSEEPSNAIAENYRAYQNFGRFMEQFVEEGTEDVWQRMAFTDYVQFFLPTIDTKKEYLSRRDFNAFNETLVELKPHIVVAWGMAIIEEIRERNPYVTDFEKLKETEWYVCHLQVPQVPSEIALVCCYHPSSVKYWYNDIDTLTKYMKEVLGLGKN